MNEKRIKNLISIFIIVFLGLISRKISVIPLFIGDILWAIMIFLIIRFLFIKKSILNSAIISLLICYLVEISQLYQAQWIIIFRSTIPGRLILGQGFLWGDIVAYTGGVLICLVFEKKII